MSRLAELKRELREVEYALNWAYGPGLVESRSRLLDEIKASESDATVTSDSQKETPDAKSN